MPKSDLEKIKGTFPISSNGDYVVLPGASLYILRPDGTLAAQRKDLRHAGRITFLSGDRMLLCCRNSFHMIDLRDGQDLWTAPYTKFELNVADLAVSPDEAFAYTYDQWKGSHFISRLDLTTRDVAVYPMDPDVGGTHGILCDEKGVPCLLKVLHETIGGKPFSQNGVRLQDFGDTSPGNTVTWKYKWQFPGNRSVVGFLGNTDAILTTDLHRYQPSTGTDLDLLENERAWQPPSYTPTDCWLDITGRWLALKYLTAHTIVDLKERRIVAQYAGGTCRGCLIGKEYWVCIDGKPCRKPFPAMEKAPPVKLVGGWVGYYAQHPEQW